MRRLRPFGIGLLVVTMLSSTTAFLIAAAFPSTAAADFNPRGRQRAKPTRPSPPKAPSQSRTSTSKATTPKKPTAATPTSPAQDDEALIHRYTAIVANQPGATFPLQRLAELYRKRDGNLDQLIAEFERRAASAGAYNALVALGGIYLQAARPEDAERTFEKATARDPAQAVAWMALARLYEGRSDHARARDAYERALPLLKDDAEREQTLRALMKLNLDANDLAGAREVHQQLVKRAKGSFFVQAELGAELLSRGQYDLAEQECRRVVKVAAGDNRALAPALRDLGKALAKQGKTDEALSTLRRALRITSAQSGLRRELLDLLVEVYRDAEKLPDLVALLEKESGNDFARLRLLGGLYEELGRIEDALKTYRAALRTNSKDLEVRLRMVRLLQIQGELDEAISEYRSLSKAAPHNPDFVFQLTEALLQQGKRDEAVAELQRLEQRARGDEQVLTSLVDYYERVGETKRSVELLERLAKSGRSDPGHVIELGDRYFQEGDTAKAQATWKRILTIIPNRARALHTLGEVYLDHDMPELALASLEEAVKAAPGDEKYVRALALALERSGSGAPKRARIERYERALRLWQQLLGSQNARTAREARQHIVTLWGLGGTLEQRIAPLERNLKADPPDLNSGRLLAEAYLRLKQLDKAERVLSRVVTHAPGDAQSLLLLEHTLVQQRRMTDAIGVLQKLVKIEPNRAREYYQRMAQYAAEMYRDDDAIRYAAKAVELSPDDAVGHKNLAEMYARRQDVNKAIAEYRAAIDKNDRLFPAYIALAELLIGQHRNLEADKLLRRVIRSATDEELLTRAARLSIQMNVGAGTLPDLERELLPIALANSNKPIYRRLLVEIYGTLTFPLVQQTRSRDAAVRERARAELLRIGQRAVKPLLDALADPRAAQQQIAIDLLTHLRNPNANQALFVFAKSDANPELRMHAMIAVGATGDVDVLPDYKELLFDGDRARVDEGDPVSLAAAWGLCQVEHRSANKLILDLLESDSPTARAVAAISASLRRIPGAKTAVQRLLDSAEYGNSSRAAAAFALGELGGKEAQPLLAELARSSDRAVRASALVALARLRSPRAAQAIADSLVDEDATLREAAVGAASLLAGGEFEPSGNVHAIPVGRVNVGSMLTELYPKRGNPELEARALVLLESELTSAVALAVARSPQQARLVSEALLASGGRPAFGELSEQLDQAPEALREKATGALERLAARAVGPFAAIAVHPSAEVRTTALLFLAHRDEPLAWQSLVNALTDSDERVRRLALEALGNRPKLETIESVVKLLTASDGWNERVHAMQSLAQFGSLPAKAHEDPRYRRATNEVAKLVTADEFAFVRESACRALVELAPERAKSTLPTVATSDAEKRVRQTAAQLLSQLP